MKIKILLWEYYMMHIAAVLVTAAPESFYLKLNIEIFYHNVNIKVYYSR